MSVNPYIKNISDFVSGFLNAPQLVTEINTYFPALAETCISVSNEGANVSILFTGVIGLADQSAVDTIVSSHSGIHTSKASLTSTGTPLTTTTLNSTQTTNRTITLPDATDTLIARNTTDTLTNKTILTASNTINIDTSDVISGTFADARIASSNITQHQSSIDHNQLLNYNIGEHRIINDAGTSLTELWSANKIQAMVTASGNPHGTTMSDVTPTTTRGDIIYHSASGVDRLPLGTSGTFLVSDGLDILWGDAIVRVNNSVETIDITAGTTINIKNINYGSVIDADISTMPVGVALTVKVQGTASKVESTDVELVAGSLFTNTGIGDYFTLSSPSEDYYVWYNVSAGNTDPTSQGTGIEVAITGAYTATQVADATVSAMSAYFNVYGVEFQTATTSQYVKANSNTNMRILRLPDSTTIPVGWISHIENVGTADIIVQDINSNEIHRIHIINTIYLSDIEVWFPEQYFKSNVITVGKYDSQFTSIYEAIESISDNSSSNRYLIDVSPNDYAEPPITMKEYVFVRGNNSSITPTTPNSILITASSNTLLENITIKNVSGNRGISCDSVLNFTLDNVVVESCFVGMYILSTSSASSILIKNCIFNNATGDEITLDGGSSSFDILVNLVSTLINSSTGSSIVAQGTYANLSLHNVILVGNSLGTGISVSDTAKITGDVKINNYNLGFTALNSGGAPVINISAIITNCATDLDIAHTTATGSIFGIFTPNIVDSPLLEINTMDNGTTIIGDLTMGKTLGNVANVSELILNGDLGLIFGGDLSFSGANIQVDAGFGYLLDTDYDVNGENHLIKKISWNTTLVPYTAPINRYMYVDSAGSIQYSGTQPDTTLNIYLGRAFSTNASEKLIDRSHKSANHYTSQISTYLADVLGAKYVSGSVVTPFNPLNLDVTTGVYYYGDTRYEPVGGSQITMKQYTYTGGWGITNSVTVNPLAYYPIGGSTLYTSGYWGKARLYIVDGPNETYLLLNTQAQYPTLEEARLADSTPVVPNSFTGGVVLIASIVIQGGIGIYEIIDERPIISITTDTRTRSHIDLLNLDTDDHTQYALLAGRAGGQTLIGGTASGEDLTLTSTSHATKGHILTDYISVNGTANSDYALTLNSDTASCLYLLPNPAYDFVPVIHARGYADRVALELSAYGQITLGRTYADVLTANGVVYGIDNEYSGEFVRDINCQNGTYRLGGKAVMPMIDYYHAESEGTSTTTSTTHTNKLSLTTSTLAVGSYFIQYSCEIWCATGGNANARMTVDGVTYLETVNDQASSGICPATGFYIRSLVSPSAITVNIDWRSTVTSVSASIRRARLILFKVQK